MRTLRTVVGGVVALGLVAGLSEAIARAVWPDAAQRIAPVTTARPARGVTVPSGRAMASTGPCEMDAGETPRGPPRSGGSIALSNEEDLAVVADADASEVIVLAIGHGAATRVRNRFPVGRSPAQVVMARDGRVFVSERADNAIAVYDPYDGRRLCRARVATDPVGLALAPDQHTVYVTSGLGHALTALDTATFARRYVVDVPREPRGLALTDDGTQAFIAHIAGAPLSLVALLDTAVPRVIPLPGVPIVTEFDVAPDLRSNWQASAPITPLPSQAFVAAIEPGRGRVLVPFMVNRTGREVPAAIRVDRYGAGSGSEAGPEAEKVSFALGSFDPATRHWDPLVLSSPAPVARFPRGGIVNPSAPRVRIPMAAVVRPDGSALIVTSSGTGTLATVPFGTSRTVAATEHTLDTPSGLAITRDGRLLVYSQFEHTVEVRHDALAERVSIGADTLPPDIARGRRLFYTASDPALSSGGLACAGCHPEGRDDGLTWFLSQGPRQTPTLAGRIELPFNWNGTQRTMEGNVAQTVTRLGGTGLSLRDVDALSAYVLHGLAAPVRDATGEARPPTPSRIEHGRALFAGAGGCTTCHDPTRNFTDGQTHELGGLGPDERQRLFDTPSLRFVSATAPYFHDGRYATLREMLLDPRHRMGHIETLASDDVDAMVAFMETL